MGGMGAQRLAGAGNGVGTQDVAGVSALERPRKELAGAAAHPIERRIARQILETDDCVVRRRSGGAAFAGGGKKREKYG